MIEGQSAPAVPTSVEAAKCVDFGLITPQAAKGGWQI
jgi:hypothetical protein